MRTIFFKTQFQAKRIYNKVFPSMRPPLESALKASPLRWMEEQIKEDIPNTAPPSDLREIMEQQEYVNKHYLNLIEIKNCQVHLINASHIHTKRAEAVVTALQNILSVTSLPNMQFLLGSGDAFFDPQLEIPVFAFAKKKGETPILIPDFEVLDGRKQQKNMITLGNCLYPWEKKLNKCIWRGSATGGKFTPENFLNFPRTKAITLSHAYPKDLDARYNLITQSDDPEKVKSQFPSYFGRWYPIHEHIKYKYQLLIDGNTSAYSRANWALHSNCTLIKQQSIEIQWYYRALISNIHYLPVENDLSDLIPTIYKLRENDTQAKEIAEAGRKFALENLSYSRVLQYVYHLLIAYSEI